MTTDRLITELAARATRVGFVGTVDQLREHLAGVQDLVDRGSLTLYRTPRTTELWLTNKGRVHALRAMRVHAPEITSAFMDEAEAPAPLLRGSEL